MSNSTISKDTITGLGFWVPDENEGRMTAVVLHEGNVEYPVHWRGDFIFTADADTSPDDRERRTPTAGFWEALAELVAEVRVTGEMPDAHYDIPWWEGHFAYQILSQLTDPETDFGVIPEFEWVIEEAERRAESHREEWASEVSDHE